LDEIQRKPDIFPLIRSLVDEWGGNGHFLVLGSSSGKLMKQSSESLAGRISYHYLSPFLYNEVSSIISLEEYIVRGGFPRSVLTGTINDSLEWRHDFITTFLERDLLQWRIFNPVIMRRLWQMLAHYNGQTINFSALGNSLGVSNMTIRNYIDLLEGTFMVDVLPPHYSNLKKRMVKTPRIYISDSGITLALLGIQTIDQLAGHPAVGAVWEQIVLNHLKVKFPRASFTYYRSTGGAEIDIALSYKGKQIAVECKISRAPALKKSNFQAIEDLNPVLTFVAAPVLKGWSAGQGIEVVGLTELLIKTEEILN
jgi:predicted AAA+ superfamily ATPase